MPLQAAFFVSQILNMLSKNTSAFLIYTFTQNKFIAMDLQSRKLSLIQEFLTIQNEEIISIIEKVLKFKTFNTEFQQMSIEELNKRIDVSLEDSKNDKVIDATKLLEEIDGWN